MEYQSSRPNIHVVGIHPKKKTTHEEVAAATAETLHEKPKETNVVGLFGSRLGLLGGSLGLGLLLCLGGGGLGLLRDLLNGSLGLGGRGGLLGRGLLLGDTGGLCALGSGRGRLLGGGLLARDDGRRVHGLEDARLGVAGLGARSFTRHGCWEQACGLVCDFLWNQGLKTNLGDESATERCATM